MFVSHVSLQLEPDFLNDEDYDDEIDEDEVEEKVGVLLLNLGGFWVDFLGHGEGVPLKMAVRPRPLPQRHMKPPIFPPPCVSPILYSPPHFVVEFGWFLGGVTRQEKSDLFLQGKTTGKFQGRACQGVATPSLP